MERTVKLLAEIYLFKNENSRQTPFFSGYRPLFNFLNAPTKISGKIDLVTGDSFEPGKKGVVNITFAKGFLDESFFKEGTHFTFDEGLQLIGEGVIVKRNIRFNNE